MVEITTPLGTVVQGKLVANAKTGQRFIRDPQTGQCWPLSRCQIVTSTDQTPIKTSQMSSPDESCPTITPADWASLKEAAREIYIPDRLFIEVLERVTGIPASQLRAGSLTYDQWADILIRLEEAAFALQVCCPLENEATSWRSPRICA